jgi:hypothetical protein
MTGGSTWPRLVGALTWSAIRRPTTGAALLGVAWRFRRRGWHRQFPFLPLPDREYVKWRMLTAYGDPDVVPPASDVIRYARWATRDR